MNKLVFLFLVLGLPFHMTAQPASKKPRIIISTDIGGTDPDDNQSMAHFLMYSNLFQTEGLISSPSYGFGKKQSILDMIDLYEKDLPVLQQHIADYPTPDALRAVTMQGRQGAAPFAGYATATEGSDWIIRCARQKNEQPLWVLVWGGLEDVAQALHDAPEIQQKIKVYWIGGPNKKWSANSYAYIAGNFPKLWFIENNFSYYGFFSKTGVPDSLSNENYYERYIHGGGFLGRDFKNYYKGNIKMGDTPSLLYLMNGEPADPLKENWGGSFERFNYSPRVVFQRTTSLTDTVAACAVVELHLAGPKLKIPADSACFTMTVQAGIGEQKWDGFYAGNGNYVIRYIPKQAETLRYKITAGIAGFTEQTGQLVVANAWPGKRNTTDYRLGSNWFTDKSAPELYNEKWQGAKTVLKWRIAVLLDWAARWAWLGGGNKQ